MVCVCDVCDILYVALCYVHMFFFLAQQKVAAALAGMEASIQQRSTGKRRRASKWSDAAPTTISSTSSTLTANGTKKIKLNAAQSNAAEIAKQAAARIALTLA